MVEQTRPPIFPLEPTERDWARAWLLLIQVKGIYPAYPGVDEQLAVIAARVPAGFGTILFRELNDGWTALNQAWIEKGEAVRYFALARAHAGIVLDRAPTQYSPDIPGRLREEAIELLAEVDRQERIWQEAVASLDAAYKALGQMNFDTARAATHRVIEASSQAPAAINALTMEAQELETAITTQKRWYGLLAEARHTLAEGQYREACTHVERLLAECRTSRYGTSISWQGDAQEFLEETEQREFREVLLPRGLRQIETALQHNGIITGHDLPELSHTQQVRLFHEYLTEHGDAGLVYLEQDGQPVLRQIQVQPSPPNSPGSPPSPEIPV
jgi:hypothetical protein